MLNLMATPDNILHLPTVAAQSVEFLIQGTGTSRSYAAHSAAGVDSLVAAANDSSPIGDISFPEAGISAVELRFDNIPEIQAGIENLSAYEFGLNFYSGFVGSEPAGDALSGSFSVMNIRNYSGSLQSFMWVRFVYQPLGQDPVIVSKTHPVTMPLSTDYKLGFYFNAATRQPGYTINGVDHGYVDLTIPQGITYLMFGVGGSELVAVGDSLVGSPVAGTLITEQAMFTEPFPEGTNGFCSNSSADPVLPNGNTFPGRGDPKGLFKLPAAHGNPVSQSTPGA